MMLQSALLALRAQEARSQVSGFSPAPGGLRSRGAAADTEVRPPAPAEPRWTRRSALPLSRSRGGHPTAPRLRRAGGGPPSRWIKDPESYGFRDEVSATGEFWALLWCDPLGSARRNRRALGLRTARGYVSFRFSHTAEWCKLAAWIEGLGSVSSPSGCSRRRTGVDGGYWQRF